MTEPPSGNDFISLTELLLIEAAAALDDDLGDEGSDRAGAEQPSITCPVCERTSYHPKDIEHGYCGFCHDWTSDPLAVDPQHTTTTEQHVAPSAGQGETSAVCPED